MPTSRRPWPQLILASASPRRAALLRSLGLAFEVQPADAPETHHAQLSACELCRINALRKACWVARQVPHALVLAADTLVSLEETLLGKPATQAAARKMLRQLQGRTHLVVTGVCLLRWRTQRQVLFTESTAVSFRRLTDYQIRQYLSRVNPLDKAGAYAIQEHGNLIIEEIAGSYTNVVGLPLERLRMELAAWRET